jgi:hypothetical protein
MGGVSNVFKLTRTTSADGRPVFTKTIEGSNLERKWEVSDLQGDSCLKLFVCRCMLENFMGSCICIQANCRNNVLLFLSICKLKHPKTFLHFLQCLTYVFIKVGDSG